MSEPNAKLKPGDIVLALASELFKVPAWCKVMPLAEDNCRGVATIGNGRTVAVWHDNAAVRLYIYNGEHALQKLFGPPPLKPDYWREYRREMPAAQAVTSLAIAINCGGPEIVDEAVRLVLGV